MLFDNELKQKYAKFEGFFILNSYKFHNIIPLEHAKFWWMFLGVGVGYPLSCWVVSRFWHWFLKFLIGRSVMTSNKKTKTQKNCCYKRSYTEKTSTELSGGKNLGLHSKCLWFKFSEISTYLSNKANKILS